MLASLQVVFGVESTLHVASAEALYVDFPFRTTFSPHRTVLLELTLEDS